MFVNSEYRLIKYYESRDFLESLEKKGIRIHKQDWLSLIHDDGFLTQYGEFRIVRYVKTETVSPLWRITIIAWPIYWVAAVITISLSWVFTGKTGLPKWVLNKIHYPWAAKLKF